MSKLIVVCKTLQDFNTLQIVRLTKPDYYPLFDCDTGQVSSDHSYDSYITTERWAQILEEHVKDLREWAVECLEKAKTGGLEGEERKKITVRTVEVGYIHPMKVREYEV